MSKQTGVHLYNGILFNNKNECTTNIHKTWMNFKCIMLSEGSQRLCIV